MDQTPISRGFRSRRQEQAPKNRISPGQYVTTEFPCSFAGAYAAIPNFGDPIRDDRLRSRLPTRVNVPPAGKPRGCTTAASASRCGFAMLPATSARFSERDVGACAPANQFFHEYRQPLELTLSPAIFDRHVLALDIAGVLEALAECAHTVRKRVRRCTAEEPDHRHGRLLCARRERPRGRAAKKRDELAPFQFRDHSITSSARARSEGGTSKRSALAVLDRK